MGSRATVEETAQYKQHLTQTYRFNEDNVLVHPDNAPQDTDKYGLKLLVI